ncbi:hypothetical protein EJB05_13247, partial [Eragrostis curvula]
LCTYFAAASVNFTKVGMALFMLDRDKGQPLQYVGANSFLAVLYADYLEAGNVTGCMYFLLICVVKCTMRVAQLHSRGQPEEDELRGGLRRQVPTAPAPPRRVHAKRRHQVIVCTGGYKWRDSSEPDPNLLTGAMVGGPDRDDGFNDSRNTGGQNEPTMAGNAGLVAALVAFTGSGHGTGAEAVDKNTMFSAIP